MGPAAGVNRWEPPGSALSPTATGRPAAWPAQAAPPSAFPVDPAGHFPPAGPRVPAGRITGVRAPESTPAGGPLPRGPEHVARTARCVPAADVSVPECCESAVVLARVGSEVILAADLLAGMDRVIRQNISRKQLDPQELERQRKQTVEEIRRAIHEAQQRGERPEAVLTTSAGQRAAMLAQLLRRHVETRLMFLDAKQQIPAEAFTQVEEQVRRHYDEHEVPKLREQLGAPTWAELDRALRARGTSLEQDFRVFFEQTLAQQWLRQKAKVDEEITYDQMMAYYSTHLDEFDKPARTRWQELRVSFSQHPSKAEAFAAIATMGNQILDGGDFAEVAQSGSDGPTASEGGVREWPEESGFLSPVVRQAIESLPIGQLSPILEDWRGYYIVRVLERKPAGLEPFVEAQSEIRDKIRSERTEGHIEQYKAELRERFPVWTILDEQPPPGGSSP